MTLCKTAYYLVFRKLCPLSRSKLLDFLWVLAWNSNMNISVIAQYIILDMRECGLVSSKLLQTNKCKETLTWNISTLALVNKRTQPPQPSQYRCVLAKLSKDESNVRFRVTLCSRSWRNLAT